MTESKRTIHEIQKEWGQFKYLVMAHSQQHYNQIRLLFKESCDLVESYVDFKRLVGEALAVEQTIGSFSNAVQHVWGYFKKIATNEEKLTFQRKLFDYQAGMASSEILVTYLRKLTIHYEIPYLLSSFFLFPQDS
ncbi:MULTISPECIES: YbgA family protein [Carnobacterium]|uniref:DUF1722 domain-containing protein n=1 Tax=Carnobacterium maltaromaticum LMA28 TaxID=1234679 RepID=K8E4C7_CARML|nr:YbgA family protein [Carnobacterium maltaromaticum]AOA02180.1 hypothetical protein BFC23_06590 [Carnobacterium maltaromaticum]KRN65756.1 hypothetical protein IV70_GL002269 [Carnobacterium maltaromaticum DSM 20342]MCI1819445.1 YbgA family protein [Carnobacterium maltaromaticum]CCO11342.2 conserved hypothetical protein [Carnobacterium maltaromaticum LMA28]